MAEGSFECSVCAEDKPHNDHIKVADTDLVCAECFDSHVKSLFQAALKYDFHFPPKWGKAVLQPQDYASHLSVTFLEE